MKFMRALLTVTPLLVVASGFWHPGCGDVVAPPPPPQLVITKSLSLGATLSHRANGIAAHGDRLWIPDISDAAKQAEVYAFDMATGEPQASYSQSHFRAFVSNVLGVAVDPNREWLWGNVYPGGLLYAVDIDLNSATYLEEVNQLQTRLRWVHDLAWYDGNLYAAECDGSTHLIHRVDPASGESTASFTTPANARCVVGITFDEVGHLWVTEGSDGRLYQVDLDQAVLSGSASGEAIISWWELPGIGAGRLAWHGGQFWTTQDDATEVYVLGFE
ncbi:MAG: hypothetical protein ABGY41_19470 [Candidatus Poribacteria bacterium]